MTRTAYRCTIATATLVGIEAVPVEVEVDVGPGLPGMSIVGLPDTAVQEARERVRSALRAQGFTMPNARIVVNLAPGPLRKTGSGFDFPIAVALLAATGQIESPLAKDALVIGELSLDGTLRSVPGLLAYAMLAKRNGRTFLSGIPEEGAFMLEGLDHRCATDLASLRRESFVVPRAQKRSDNDHETTNALDFSDVSGHGFAKRALLIAAAGLHGISMIGPPGSGKTMLARRIPSILPSLTHQEALETSLVHSVIGFDTRSILAGERPFRSPHHSASATGLVGGGSIPRPGEVSLAHNGVLFLDEMPQFAPSVLQALRQPLEDGFVTLVRAEGRTKYPARFMLAAASNPCPCGHYNDPEIPCTCKPDQVARYHNRIGGPLLDRIDLSITVGRVDPHVVIAGGSGLSSTSLRERVMTARFRMEAEKRQNALLSGKALFDAARMNILAQDLLESLAKTHRLSGRGIVSILRVARTIADIEESDRVTDDHLAEASSYRVN